MTNRKWALGNGIVCDDARSIFGTLGSEQHRRVKHDYAIIMSGPFIMEIRRRVDSYAVADQVSPR